MAIRAGYPKVVPYGADAGGHVVDIQPAGDLTPCTWYRAGVTDEMTEALRADLGDDGLVELTMLVAVENLRSRFNSTLGLSSQGFSESCRVPDREPTA